MKPLTFLLADANTPYRHILHLMIQAHRNWRIVAEAGDGAEAVRLAARCSPEVVLIDVHTPVMDGIETTRQIKVAAPQTRVIAFSGYPDEEFRRASLRAGADHYLYKEDLNAESLAQLISAFFPQAEHCEP